LRGSADAARVNRLHDGEGKDGGCDGHNHAGENDAVTHNVLPSKERTSPWSREAASTFNRDDAALNSSAFFSGSGVDGRRRRRESLTTFLPASVANSSLRLRVVPHGFETRQVAPLHPLQMPMISIVALSADEPSIQKRSGQPLNKQPLN
jgi:hypothetical protein